VDPQEVLSGLDDEQRAVAETLEGPVMVLAGAGTGKTRAITHRIAYGVLTGAHEAHRTLAVTFTNRAAGELRGRLRGLGVSGVQARTFHAASLRQLRYFWPRMSEGGFPDIMPSKAALVARALSAHDISPDTSLVRDVSSDIEWARVNFHDEHSIATIDTDRSLAITPAELARVMAAYEEAKSDRGVIDFEDVMIVLIGALTTDESIAREVRNAYRWFTVDEFQDVNPIQHKLLGLWRGERDDLCVVGDPSQTIYSFTGASPNYLLRFPQELPGATTVRLVRCYRCSPQIVELANGLIHAGASARNAVTLRSQTAPGVEPTITDYADDVTEARSVAERIARAISAGTRPRDIAVLYRINAQAVEIESALADEGVPVTVRGSERFFERAEIREAITRLRAAARFVDESQSSAATSLTESVVDVLSAMGWSPQQPTTTGAVRERWESLAALVELARETPTQDLPAFVTLLDERASSQFAPVADGVTLASVHAAKGLEWPIVYVIGCSDGLIPLQHADGPDQVEEERRLLYVAMTRAARELHMSWAQSRQPGGRTNRQVSRFLASIARAPIGDDRAFVKRGAGRKGGRGKGRRGPAQCRACGKALVTPGERTIGRCRTCPSTFNESFFEELKEWRLAHASERNVPAYVVFTDATLIAVAEQLPDDREALSAIPGIGPAKLDAYGEELLELVRTQR
jgi:DNA helicase-2/ATP-dependent DNA helicase PcrA